MTWKVRMVFTNEDKSVIFEDYRAKKTELISWQAVVAFSSGPTDVEDATGSADRK